MADSALTKAMYFAACEMSLCDAPKCECSRMFRKGFNAGLEAAAQELLHSPKPDIHGIEHAIAIRTLKEPRK